MISLEITVNNVTVAKIYPSKYKKVISEIIIKQIIKETIVLDNGCNIRVNLIEE